MFAYPTVADLSCHNVQMCMKWSQRLSELVNGVYVDGVYNYTTIRS